MRELPVRLSPATPPRRGGPLGELLVFLLAFAAMFGGAMLGLDVLL